MLSAGRNGFERGEGCGTGAKENQNVLVYFLESTDFEQWNELARPMRKSPHCLPYT